MFPVDTILLIFEEWGQNIWNTPSKQRLTDIFLEIIIDSHATIQSNTQRSHVLFNLFLLIVVLFAKLENTIQPGYYIGIDRTHHPAQIL